MAGGKSNPAIWWLIWCIIALIGFLVALSGYNHGLPYIDFGDEMTLWTMGRAGIDPLGRWKWSHALLRRI
ncbi:MAG TPA: hypothetical protein VK003_00405 [Oceanobacillus sp.]|nr:hypothetical protein [Oceanobacillus sp.]